VPEGPISTATMNDGGRFGGCNQRYGFAADGGTGAASVTLRVEAAPVPSQGRAFSAPEPGRIASGAIVERRSVWLGGDTRFRPEPDFYAAGEARPGNVSPAPPVEPDGCHHPGDAWHDRCAVDAYLNLILEADE